MANFRWYASRLRSMSIGEIGWRLRRSAASRLEKVRADPGATAPAYPADELAAGLARWRASIDRPVLLDRTKAQRLAEANPERASAVVVAADRVRDGRVAYFGYPEVELGTSINWHADPLAGVHWDPAGTVDYRTADADVKWIWELNRLQHLPWLAQAWLLTGEPEYGSAVFEQLDSWVEQNPPGSGIGWRNPFEPGVRAISVALALQGLRDHPELTEERFGRYATMLAASAHRCFVDRSRYSSANNHLIGEMAGLAVVALLLPDLPDAPEWEQRALAVLTDEVDLQILADGSGAEQAVGYQMFTVELTLVVGALMAVRDGLMPQAIRRAADRSAVYLSALVDDADPAPRYGDDDEGFALRLDSTPVRTVRDHLGIVGALTGCDVARRHAHATWSSDWFALTRSAARVDDNGPVPTSLVTAGANHYAPAGGLVVLRRADRRVLVDVGPLGYLSIAAHGHADALAVGLSVGGHDIIGDPGPASYYGHPDWRRIHRGTRVHGTVEVDRCDQSVMAGPFIWSSHARVRVLAVDVHAGIVDAEHDGYRRLSGAVMHRRWVAAGPDDDAVVVVDLLSGFGHHEVRTSWPLAPEYDVAKASVGHVVSRDGSPVLQVAAAATAPLVDDAVRGDDVQGLGWWSNRLESREPAWLIGSSTSGPLPLVLATVLQPRGDGLSITDLEVTRNPGAIDVTWSNNRARQQCSIDTTRHGAVVRTTPRPIG